MNREWILRIIILFQFSSFCWANDNFCSKEKDFAYRPDIQYLDNSFLHNCYLEKEEFLVKQGVPGFILADLRSIEKQKTFLVSSAVPYSVLAIKSLLSSRNLNVVLLPNRGAPHASMELCFDASFKSRPYLIPYGERGAQAYGLLVRGVESYKDLFSVDSLSMNYIRQLDEVFFVIPSSKAKSKNIEGLNVILMESIDLNQIHMRMRSEALGRSIAVIPRLLYENYIPDNNLMKLYPEIYNLDRDLNSFVEDVTPSSIRKKIIRKGC
jgi:hypothetical protein